MNSSRLSSRGTSLIEAMAALVVFSVGILGVMQMNVLASQQNNLARTQTIASKIGRDIADSFEPLPFDHPLFANRTSILLNDPEFFNMDNPDGRTKLPDAVAQGVARPILGAADAMFTSEGHGDFYEVAWRVQAVADPDRYNQEDQLRILIMVRFRTPGGGLKQVNTWAVKYDVRQITGDDKTLLEL
jgi:type IV pilus assembly protein PilV